MYGVIVLFDGETEQMIKEIWKELKEKSISNYAYEVEDRRPHITLASYNHIDIKTFMRQMDEFYEDKEAIDITFSTIGSFLNSGTLFFSPIIIGISIYLMIILIRYIYRIVGYRIVL